CVQGGTEQITLKNESQPVPWKFEMILRGVQMKVQYGASLTGANAKSALDWLQFQAALAKPGRLLLDQVHTGFQNTALHDNGSGVAPHPGLVALVKEAAAIQVQTNTILTIP